MKSLAVLFIVITQLTLQHTSFAQCYRPKPMTPAQIAEVKGQWKGSYVHEGEEHSVVFSLYLNDDNRCQIDSPPVTGKETGEQIRFCDGGEFHLRKDIGDLSYEFQGTPIAGKISGMLTIRRNGQKVGSNGRFTVEKTEK